MSKYVMPPEGLFGRRCKILTDYDRKPFVYRILRSGVQSNTWIEPPITWQSERNPVRHDHMEEILFVVCDTLIDENSKIIRVALNDVELMPEKVYEEYRRLMVHNIGNVDIPDGMSMEQFHAVMNNVVDAIQHTERGESWPYERVD